MTLNAGTILVQWTETRVTGKPLWLRHCESRLLCGHAEAAGALGTTAGLPVNVQYCGFDLSVNWPWAKSGPMQEYLGRRLTDV